MKYLECMTDKELSTGFNLIQNGLNICVGLKYMKNLTTVNHHVIFDNK